MAERPNSNISKPLVGKINTSKGAIKGQMHHPDVYLTDVDDLIQKLDLTQSRAQWPAVSTAHAWKAVVHNLKRHHNLLYEYYNDITNEENTTNRIETKAAWRNLLFRVGTTALVALTLGGAYSIAGNSDSLYLPLQQKTITYYYEEKHHLKPPTDPSKYEAPTKEVKVTGSSKGKLPATTKP
jgi:hypothetical protein